MPRFWPGLEGLEMKPVVILHPSMRHEVEALLADDSAAGEAALTRDMLRSVDCLYQGELGRVNGLRIVHTNARAPRLVVGRMPRTTAVIGEGRW